MNSEQLDIEKLVVDGALPPEMQERHDKSVELYPEIQFAKNEYVVLDVQRTIWGLVLIWSAALVTFIVISLFAIMMVAVAEIDSFTMFAMVIALGVMCLVGGAVGQYVFRQNLFVVTNKRVFSRIQTTPFSHINQNIELWRIEDCSYQQDGPLQTMFNFGAIRLSTIGDENTYNFTFVARPAEQFNIINRVVVRVMGRGKKPKL